MIVADVEAAIAAVGLTPDQRVANLTGADAAAFRRLVGWEPGGPVVASDTPPEQAARTTRQRWKAARLGRDLREPRLLFQQQEIERARSALATNSAPDWLHNLLRAAREVAGLGLGRLLPLIPTQVPWNASGSFCPACFGDKSDVATHAPFWRWHVDEPDTISCPHCGIRFPHQDYPEEGRLELPRLGLSYSFYLTPAQRQRDWRNGAGASSFGGGPTHVSLSGEVARCALNWLLGQLEPMALAAAVSADRQLGDVVRALLQRLAQVYPGYPLYSYRQEYYDCDPAYAVEHCNRIPTPFRRAACLYSYSGQLGDNVDLHGRGANTVADCHYPNAEWGCSRLAREKASHGQLYLSLLHAWDLVAADAPDEMAEQIEADLLLEYYLDVKGLTGRIDNKSGPGTAARVATGLMWNDEAEIADGVDRFLRLLAGQFHDDGSWKETPIYGAKALVEGLWEVPELLRARGMYEDTPLLRRAFEVYATAATPCGTQPGLDDSAVDFSLPTHLRDLARLRLGLHVPAAAEQLTAFGPVRSGRCGFGGYIPRVDMAPRTDDRTSDRLTDRHPGDGGVGFAAVGHILRRAPDSSWVPLLCGPGPTASGSPRPALTRFFRGRGLACMGAGSGPRATQLYVDGGDGGGHGHRHAAPLSLMGFHAGREVFPDLGYIADHPANGWIRATASHNTVLINGRSVVASSRCELAAFAAVGAGHFVDLRVPLQTVGAEAIIAHARRALLLLPTGTGTFLLDVFELHACETAVFDYVCRAGTPGMQAESADLAWQPRGDSIFADSWPTPPRQQQTAGACAGFTVRWPGEQPVAAAFLMASDEVMRFHSPAWRTQTDVFEQPELAWTALVSRQRGPSARYVNVFALDGILPDIEVQSADTDIVLRVNDGASTTRVHLADAAALVEGI